MRISRYIKKNEQFIILLSIVLLVHLIFLPGFHEIWWDSGVYVGMGKHVFSVGSAGLWEHIRPPFWPLILGVFWFLGIDPVFFGLLFELIFSLGAVVLFYGITKYYFDEKAALFGSVLFAFSSIFFYLSFHLYTEVPAVFFALLAIYLFISKRYYLSGIFITIACLTKFPMGLFFPVLLLVLLLNKDFKNSLRLSAGFIVSLIPVLIVFQLFYGNALLPFIDARETILQVLGCNVLRFKPWWHYFYLILSENALNLFAVIGLIAFFLRFKKKKLLPLFCLVAPLIYFSQLHCRDYRYLALFIPFVAMFSGYGIAYFVDKIKNYKRQAFYFALFVVLGFSVFTGVLFYLGNENTVTNPVAEDYFRWLEDKDVSGEIWSSNPVVSVYTDAKIRKIYYPVYDAGISADFYDYLSNESGRIEYVFLDNCGGGIICSPDDSVCEEENKKIINFLDSSFEKISDETYGNCFYLIYKN